MTHNVEKSQSINTDSEVINVRLADKDINRVHVIMFYIFKMWSWCIGDFFLKVPNSTSGDKERKSLESQPACSESHSIGQAAKQRAMSDYTQHEIQLLFKRSSVTCNTCNLVSSNYITWALASPQPIPSQDLNVSLRRTLLTMTSCPVPGIIKTPE